MSDDREQRIRDRAYRLWEEEGRPEGRHDAHWQDAARTVDEAVETEVPAEPAPIPPAADPDADQAPLAMPDIDQAPADAAPLDTASASGAAVAQAPLAAPDSEQATAETTPPAAAPATARRAPAKGRGRKNPA